MTESRSKKATRNVFFAIILKVYQIILPFVIRTVFIYTLGIEYLGLNSLFTSILGVLSLAELGFGTALVFSLYEPLAKKDTNTICALMNFYKKCYTAIGLVILSAGLLITPFLPSLIKSDLPSDVNLYILYFIQLLSTVITYLFFAYKNSLLIADQRNDITSKIGIISSTLQYVLQLGSLIFVRNYYAYVIVVPFTTVIGNFITFYLTDKKYPAYRPQGKIDDKLKEKIIQKVKALFVVKIGNVVLNSVDSIVVSAFLGLTILGLYNNYYYVVSSVVGIVGLLTASITSTLGNSIVTESVDKNYKDFKFLSFWNFWIVGWFTICMVCLYQPFMELWVGVDKMLPVGIAVLLSCYFYVLQANQVAGAYKDAAGIWNEDKFRPLLTAGTNLVVNIISVQFIGLYGIVFSTVISLLFVNTPWLIHNVTRLVFKTNGKEYLIMYIKNLMITTLSLVICYLLSSLVPMKGLIKLIGIALICVIVPNICYVICYRKNYYFRMGISRIMPIVKKLFPH